jgi:hypothetical protein
VRNIVLAWCYILAMINLVVWSGVYGNISHSAPQYQRIDTLNAAFKVKAQWI